MQLEVGKYYKTRDGRKVGPMYKTGSEDKNMEFDDGSGNGWTKHGTWLNTCQNERDLIAEWPSETAQTTLTAIDHLRKAAELFLAAGNDKAAFDVLGVVLDHE